MANRNFLSQKVFSMRGQPVSIDMSFKVNHSAADGIEDLSGPLVEEVLMRSVHATPSATIEAGYIKIQLSDNYNALLTPINAMIRTPNSGSDVKIDNSAMTAGRAYVITTLGNATAAKWLAIGVPEGVTPAVGVSFIALTNGGSGNTLTSRVQAVATTSAVASIEVVGNPAQSVAPDPDNKGSHIILVCRDYAGAIVAPAQNSVISLQMLMNNSSISGE